MKRDTSNKRILPNALKTSWVFCKEEMLYVSYLTMLLFGMIIKMDRMQLTSLLTNEKRSIFWPIGNSHSMLT
jgi:hypothetical protein